MLTKEQNELLTRVDGHTPMGALMREHYWIPAALGTQLVRGGDPLRVRLLGRSYVAYRASDGRLGFMDEGCPHRGASLVLARSEGCALRCIFHGWKIDVSGAVVEVPTHSPNPAAFAAKVKVQTYPTHEGGGIVWVWLGTREAPRFPELPFTLLRDSQVWVTVTKSDCNWLQGVEATLDSAHVGTLHTSYISRVTSASSTTIAGTLDVAAPRYKVARTAYGLDASALRPLPDGSTYLRITKYIMPFISLVPGSKTVPGTIFISSPIDDTHHNLFFGMWSMDDINNGRDVPEAQQFGIGTRPYDPHDFASFSGGMDTNWGQDRAAMRAGHFSGMTGNLLQEDIVTQVSMGPIVDRTKEHLSSSDVAIVGVRQLLLDAIRDVQEGRAPAGSGPASDHRDVVPIDTIVARSAENEGHEVLRHET